MSYKCLVLFLPQSTDIFDIFLNSEQQLEYICVVLSKRQGNCYLMMMSYLYISCYGKIRTKKILRTEMYI